MYYKKHSVVNVQMTTPASTVKPRWNAPPQLVEPTQPAPFRTIKPTVSVIWDILVIPKSAVQPKFSLPVLAVIHIFLLLINSTMTTWVCCSQNLIKIKKNRYLPSDLLEALYFTRRWIRQLCSDVQKRIDSSWLSASLKNIQNQSKIQCVGYHRSGNHHVWTTHSL